MVLVTDGVFSGIRTETHFELNTFSLFHSSD